MRFYILAYVLLLAVVFNAVADDLYQDINRLRAGEGECAVAKKVPPLKPQAVLDRVARDLSQGGKLEQSLNAAGYRAARSRAFSIRGDGVGARAAGLLATQGYCQGLLDAATTEVGIYLDARQVWVVMAAPFVSSMDLTPEAAGQRVLDLVNQARATPRYCGKQWFYSAQPLRWNRVLAEAAQRHSDDMARNNYFSHSGRDGSNPARRVERAGYRYRGTGENIAAGGRMKAEDAVAGWIKSPGHCANLMHAEFTEMGAAYAINPASRMGVYWTQEFGVPR